MDCNHQQVQSCDWYSTMTVSSTSNSKPLQPTTGKATAMEGSAASKLNTTQARGYKCLQGHPTPPRGWQKYCTWARCQKDPTSPPTQLKACTMQKPQHCHTSRPACQMATTLTQLKAHMMQKPYCHYMSRPPHQMDTLQPQCCMHRSRQPLAMTTTNLSNAKAQGTHVKTVSLHKAKMAALLHEHAYSMTTGHP